MKYGFFDDKNNEYVITNPKTPVKWTNYVGSLKFGGIVDQTGGTLLCKGDPALNRITKYIPQLPSANFKGTTCYVRFKTDSGYKVFSPFFVPTLDKYDLYECHVGLGYTKIISEFYGIRSEITIFVPDGSSVLLNDIKVTNKSGQARDIDIIPVVEYTHFDALKQYTNADWVPQTMQSEAIKDETGLTILKQCAFIVRGEGENYFTANKAVSSFETDRARFLGDNEYRTWASPLALEADEFSNYEALRGDNIAAFLYKAGSVADGGDVRFITQLGQEPSIDDAAGSIKKYRDEAEVDKALADIKEYWKGYLAPFQVSTPDKTIDSLINVWNPRQCQTTKNWSRYLSLYQLGLGARGIGFRDSSQDVMGVIMSIPEEAKELICMLLSVQKTDGSAMHQFNPITMIANEGDSREEEDRPDYYGDDHLWIVLAVSAYLKETGDYDFLNHELPFYEKDKNGLPREKGSVHEHLRRSIKFTWNNTGEKGLPLLGFADWNDTVNLKTGAQSMFNANLFGKALVELMDLENYLGNSDQVKEYEEYYQKMKDNYNEHCWDGNWYVRYFDYDGSPIGSDKNEKGKIYTNGQSWPVISGFATPERAKAALESVNKMLNTKNGIKLSTPGYNGYDNDIGGVSSYPPGAKENGGIFLHSNPWVIIAETINGNGNRAFEYYSQINPIAKNENIDEFECEPYVFPQNILGDEHPQFGLARNSWLSGTSSWTYQAGTQYILGLRPSHKGLIVDPCIPTSWEKFTVKRVFRGTTYNITVKNPDKVSKGVKSVTVNGKAAGGNVLPAGEKGGVLNVEVVMG